jgi:arylsulfatase A
MATANLHSRPNPNFVFLYLSLFVLYALVGCKKVESLTPAEQKASSASVSDLVAGKPNVIFILGDDIGYEIPTIDGGRSYNTKNIDFMAQNGMRFTQCYGAPDCSPARFMLLTGKYNFRNYREWGVMDRTQRTIGNMLKGAGYATCYAGKWQLDGGDVSIRTFGFDKYSVWLPFKKQPEDNEGPRYKSPPIYQDGGYLPSTQTHNKYSVDIFTNYITNFIDAHKASPFFIYYSIPLAHKPFVPTPDDPEYNTYDFSKGSFRFFPSMVKYMDKQVGILMDKIKSLGLDKNTVFIFLGDNGTPKGITSSFNGIKVPGEKGQTTTYGTHVPLIFYWPTHTSPGVTNQLVDFTDLMPTLANITGTPVPTNNGIIDGKSFASVLSGSASSSRDHIFLHFQPSIDHPLGSKLYRYASTATYKLYDADSKYFNVLPDRAGQFYNVVKDVHEKNPISKAALTAQEAQIKQSLQDVLNQMHN